MSTPLTPTPFSSSDGSQCVVLRRLPPSSRSRLETGDPLKDNKDKRIPLSTGVVKGPFVESDMSPKPRSEGSDGRVLLCVKSLTRTSGNFPTSLYLRGRGVQPPLPTPISLQPREDMETGPRGLRFEGVVTLVSLEQIRVVLRVGSKGGFSCGLLIQRESGGVILRLIK